MANNHRLSVRLIPPGPFGQDRHAIVVPEQAALLVPHQPDHKKHLELSVGSEASWGVWLVNITLYTSVGRKRHTAGLDLRIPFANAD
jgi:hypothetical protein